MNNELASLYEADRQDRINQPKANTAEYKAMRVRDLERRVHVIELLATNKLHILGHRPAHWMAAAIEKMARRTGIC